MRLLIAAGGSLDPRGPAAETILSLTWLLTGLGVAVFVVFAVALAVGLARKRPVSPGSAALRWIVGGGVVLPVAVLLVVFGFTAQAMRDTPQQAPPGSLQIEVVGHQWWWEVRYPETQVVTANEMHIPAGRPVELHLTSVDVIHSFWVPALAGKLDLLPDKENVLVIEAAAPGEYRGSCAEFCGLQHANMRFLVVAEDPERFSAWLDRQQRPAPEPDDSQALRGQKVFAGVGCARCHTVEGTAAGGDRGPDLTHLASRRSLAAGTVENRPSQLARWLAHPDDIKAEAHTEAPPLTEDDVEALVAYLETLE